MAGDEEKRYTDRTNPDFTLSVARRDGSLLRS